MLTGGADGSSKRGSESASASASASAIAGESEAAHPSMSRYSVYWLYWYKSTNTDARERIESGDADTRHGAVRACARLPGMHTSAYVSIRQHTYVPTELYERALASQVCIRLHTSAYVSMRQHTSAYLSIPQHTYAAPLQPKHVPAICNYVC
jgi:hypothetical protein